MQSGNMGWEKDVKRGNFIGRKETDDDDWESAQGKWTAVY